MKIRIYKAKILIVLIVLDKCISNPLQEKQQLLQKFLCHVRKELFQRDIMILMPLKKKISRNKKNINKKTTIYREIS